jgi:dethiobiotin synthase
MSGFFITGTDTNVGKTVLSALLCAALDGCYWKPIQTGAREGTDRDQVMAWTGISPERALPEAYLFDDPVSPHLAARRAGKRIDLQQIVQPPVNGISTLIVEGAGGVLVPVNEDETMADLMRHLGLPVILATRTTLGTINHTLLSLEELRSSRLTIHGVVMLGEPDHENQEAIEHYGRVPVLGIVPPLSEINAQTLRSVFTACFDCQALKS